jgi:CRISPR/Cas system-associated exonuclease Cas4 (RecB family)
VHVSQPGKRTRNIYDPAAPEPFKLSRSKIELFVDCPRCFWLDRRRGVGRPSGPPFNLNIAVDALLKKEFDLHRAGRTAHPLMKAYRIDAIPYQHPQLNEWREYFIGVQHLDKKTNLLITGAVDDVWVNPQHELIVVDYKATSKATSVNIDAEWQNSYKRQMEVYQWLLRGLGFKVSNLGYFVYCNGKADKKAFDGKLEFDVKVIPYEGRADWIEPKLLEIKVCLDGPVPEPHPECEFCAYRAAALAEENSRPR